MIDLCLLQRVDALHHEAASSSKLGRVEEAFDLGLKATAINRRLAGDHPEIFLPGLAVSLQALAVQQRRVGNLAHAAEACDEAIAAYRRMLGAGPFLEHESERSWSPLVVLDAQPHLLGLLITLGLGGRFAAECDEVDRALALLRERIFVAAWIEAISLREMAAELESFAIRPYLEATLKLPAGKARKAAHVGVSAMGESARLMRRGLEAPSYDWCATTYRFGTAHVAAAEESFAAAVNAPSEDSIVVATREDHELTLRVRGATDEGPTRPLPPFA